MHSFQFLEMFSWWSSKALFLLLCAVLMGGLIPPSVSTSSKGKMEELYTKNLRVPVFCGGSEGTQGADSPVKWGASTHHLISSGLSLFLFFYLVCLFCFVERLGWPRTCCVALWSSCLGFPSARIRGLRRFPQLLSFCMNSIFPFLRASQLHQRSLGKGLIVCLLALLLKHVLSTSYPPKRNFSSSLFKMMFCFPSGKLRKSCLG